MFLFHTENYFNYLEAELGSSPVSSLGVISDGVISLHPNPLRDRSVLLHLLTEDSLELETFNSSLRANVSREKSEILSSLADVHKTTSGGFSCA